jgi:D-lyxose ketol-isomerase
VKRSEINQEISLALRNLSDNNFFLPEYSKWSPEEWKYHRNRVQTILKCGLGWDVTDYGFSNFSAMGSTVFTIRNGWISDTPIGTPYAEKVLVIKPGQKLPLHYHFSKTEDIINRGGGILRMKLYHPLDTNELDRKSPVDISCDGIPRKLEAGEELDILPGNSVTVPPRLYHIFWAKEDLGTLICGEVSSVNNDYTDNHHLNPVKRYIDVEEDENPEYLLCNEYEKVLY